MRSFLSNDLQEYRTNRKIYLILFVFPVVLMLLLIYKISSLETITVYSEFLPLDKIYHFTVFMLLSYSLFRMMSYKNYKLGWIFLNTFLFSTLYGVLDEVHQLYVPNRFFDYNDILADAFGSLVGVLLGLFFYRYDYKFLQNKFKINQKKISI